MYCGEQFFVLIGHIALPLLSEVHVCHVFIIAEMGSEQSFQPVVYVVFFAIHEDVFIEQPSFGEV